MAGIDLNELLLAAQASTLESAGKDHVVNMGLMAKTAIKKYDEVDLLQAASAKELSKAGLATDLNSMRPPVLAPFKTA